MMFRGHTTKDKNKEIETFLHYSDPRANGDPITVFGSPNKNAFYNYSDRLEYGPWQDATKKVAERKINPKTAKFFEEALKLYHKTKKLKLFHIMVGVNRSSGYHYLIFGYEYEEPKENKDGDG